MKNIIKNHNFENQMEGWTLKESTKVTFCEVEKGRNAAFVQERGEKDASIAQDITAEVRRWGCGDYHISAAVKPSGTTIGALQLVISAIVDGQKTWFTEEAEVWEANYSTIEGVVTILWKNSIEGVLIYFQNGGHNAFDFYCFDINVSKIDEKAGTSYEDYFNAIPQKEVYAGRNKKPFIGAIRWDAWLNPKLPTSTAPGAGPKDYIGAQMVRSLSPTQYHFRLPYFGIVESKDKVNLPDYTQEQFDEEQKLASEAGIDYWCYCWYKDGSGMDMARHFHTTSKYKHLVSMCCMMSENDFKNPSYFIEQMKMDIWTLVDNGRPLVFLHAMGGAAPKKESVENFRKAAMAAGLKNPYILGMANFGIATSLVKNLELEGISDYAIDAGGAQPFRKLMELVESKWDTYRTSGVNVVPCVMTGWDRRPRIDHPVTWEGPTADKSGWIETATPEEIGEHLQNALTWNDSNKGYTPFNSVLIYAWNEHDEGGWLCPTIIDDDKDGLPERNEDGTNKPDMRRLEAIKRVILK